MQQDNFKVQIQELVRSTHLKNYSIDIDLKAYECNGWPMVKIILNDKTYFEGQAKGDAKLKYSVDAKDDSLDVCISMQGKTNRNITLKGEKIERNQYCVIEDIRINGISMKHEHDAFWQDSLFVKNDGAILHKTDGLYHNGDWKLSLPEPVFPLLNKKFQDRSGGKFSPKRIKPDHLEELVKFITSV